MTESRKNLKTNKIVTLGMIVNLLIQRYVDNGVHTDSKCKCKRNKID